jgi:hypothetical protein
MYFNYLIKSLSAVAVLFLFFSRSNYAEKFISSTAIAPNGWVLALLLIPEAK